MRYSYSNWSYLSLSKLTEKYKWAYEDRRILRQAGEIGFTLVASLIKLILCDCLLVNTFIWVEVSLIRNGCVRLGLANRSTYQEQVEPIICKTFTQIYERRSCNILLRYKNSIQSINWKNNLISGLAQRSTLKVRFWISCLRVWSKLNSFYILTGNKYEVWAIILIKINYKTFLYNWESELQITFLLTNIRGSSIFI